MPTKIPKILKGKKASQVFLDYCSPLLDDLTEDDIEDLDVLREALRVPWIIWNATIFGKEKENKVDFNRRMKLLTQTMPGAEGLLDFWKDRKQEKFSKYEYLMGEYQLIPISKGEFTLRIEARSIDRK